MEYFISIAVMFIEYLSLINVGQALLIQQSRKKVVLFAICHIVISFFALNFIFENNTIKYICVFGMLFLVYVVCFKGHIIKKIFATFVYIVILYGTDYLTMLGLSILSDTPFDQILFNPVVYIMIISISKFMLFFITYLLKVFYKFADKSFSVNPQYVLYSIIFPAISVITIITLFDLSVDYVIDSYWITFVVLGIIAANIVLLFLLDYLEVDRKKKQDILIMQQQTKSDTSSFEMIKELYDKHRRLTHDYHNHLIAIHSMAENNKNDKIVEYVSDIVNDISDDVAINSNNMSVDAILNQKYFRAIKEGIAMRFEFNDLSKLQMLDYDIVTILSNALDNAIEACRNIADKHIKVKIMDNDEVIIISVLNTSEFVEIIDNEVITTKKEKNLHGYGLKNIKRTVLKYNGVYAISYNEGWFQLSIMINK